MEQDIKFMKYALKEAKKAYLEGEVPIGCVIVEDGKIISRAHNKRMNKKDIFAHAEILALKKASKLKDSWILDNLTIYVTVEPCSMCASSLLQSRIKRVVYGTSEPKFGSFGSILNLNDYKFNHHVELTKGVLQEECEKLMKDFFKEIRNNKNKQ